MQPDDILRGLPGYPFTAWALVALALVAGAVRTWQNRPQKQSQTNANLGARLQRIEQAHELTQVRRLQVEHELTRLGVRLPYWPGDPAPTVQPLHSPPAPADYEDDDDLGPETAQRVTIPPLPDYSRHHRRTDA
jgi:hypothetical protein